MIRFWIGTALLAGSWLLGLNYFFPANPYAWLAAVAAGVLLLGKTDATSNLKPLAGDCPNFCLSKNGTVPFGDTQLKAIAISLLLPAVWFAVWPYRTAPLLIVLGLATSLLPIRKRWADWFSSGAVTAGVVLLVQALALELYATHTSHTHELPSPLPDMLAGIASLLGIDATADGSNIVMHSMRQVHRLGATWELLLDPASFLFFIGGLAMLACNTGTPQVEASASETTDLQETGESADRGFMPEWRNWISNLRTLTLVMVAWLPVRAGLLMALYIHRVLRSDPDRPLHAMNHFFSPWFLLLLLVVPVLLAWWFVRTEKRGLVSAQLDTEVSSPVFASSTTGSDFSPLPSALRLPPSALRLPLSPFPIAGLIALAIALFTAAVYWCPAGGRKDGRVMVVERHSQWEPTTKPYDTEWFVEPTLFEEGSGYNYARIYRYLEQFYGMSRLSETDKIDDATLAKCDVLVIKTPTERYTPQEAAAVGRFVEQGGGLLLIGDHTNYERSSTVMNDIARPMGFIFRDDMLLSFNPDVDEQLYVPPSVPHPVVQHVPPMNFAVSCSIDPGHSHGRAVIANTGLWSMGPEYHHLNFFPFPQNCPAMRYGAFVQAWAAQHGKGRVIAFGDSTIFSNFCLGQPGKTEMMLGMVEWLNRAAPWLDPRPWLIVLGLLPLGAGVWMAMQQSNRRVWLVLLAAGTCGWAVASLAVIGMHRWAMPTPERLHPERCVVIDRNSSTVPLSNGPDTRGGGEGFGLFEQWLARLDSHTVRKEGAEAFSGDVLVAICPSRSISQEYQRKLERYVEGGGKLLVVDSPENIGSTANSLLWPFGLSINRDAWKGKLTTAAKLPEVDVAKACEVVGGQPVARIGRFSVAAVVRHGKGSVMAIGFASLWNDKGMGETWGLETGTDGNISTDLTRDDLPGWTLELGPDGKFQPRFNRAESPGWMLEPNATVRARYKVLFGLLRPFFNDKPWPAFPVPATEKSKDGKDSVLKESGPAEL